MQIQPGPAVDHGPVRRPNAHAESRKQSEPANATPAADTVTLSEGKTRGVLRLLEEGHFRGVADVRLRMNFHDELQGMEFSSLAGEVGDQVTGLDSSVGERIAAAIDDGALSDDQADALASAQSEFSTAAGSLIDSFADGDVASLQADLQSLRELGDSLLSSVSDLLTPTGANRIMTELPTDVRDAPVSPDDAVTPGDAVTPDEAETPDDATQILENLLSELQELITSTLDEISTAVASADVLPPLSEPKGNGGAYDKFLAAYQELLQRPSGDDVLLDTSA